MSGGVDSSVAAALVRDAGHEAVGATLKLWGGESDSGCCSISDVDDARRVADRLGIDHHTFGFADEFTRHVVGPYVSDHAVGRTPNPCIECNRHLKFAAAADRARALGFDAVATGHHARIVERPDGSRRVARGADAAKDQSYVLHMLDQEQMARTLFPIGAMTKAEVRTVAADLGLRTAAKPDSQDVCFITRREGRGPFLGDRIDLTPATVVDADGREVGRVPAVELVTIGQRKGLGLAGGGPQQYVVAIDRTAATPTVTVGPPESLDVAAQAVTGWAWASGHPPAGPVTVAVQTSAHGVASPAEVGPDPDAPADPTRVVVRWHEPHRRVAPGQSVVAYDADTVAGAGTA
jgi:tRNA-specific 2-thiouridylase